MANTPKSSRNGVLVSSNTKDLVKRIFASLSTEPHVNRFADANFILHLILTVILKTP